MPLPSGHSTQGRHRVLRFSLLWILFSLAMPLAHGQGLQIRHGTPVPIEVKTLYESGLTFLISQQNANGSWTSQQYGNGPGIDGLCCLVILSNGDDPNFGRYADSIRRGLRSIIGSQDAQTGLIAMNQDSHGNMYHHGFATLALAEAYGAVDEQLLWDDQQKQGAPIGTALERAVMCLLTSQNQNPFGGWRYTPAAKDADTSVSGACIVALLAARNAGIEIPEANLTKSMNLLKQSTDTSGSVVYQVGSSSFSMGDSLARSSIACLGLAVGGEKQSAEFQATLGYLRDRVDRPSVGSFPYYSRYYMAQALFQGDFEAWQKWNRMNIEILQDEQGENGAIGGSTYSTAMSLLSMALNYRFLPIYER